MAEGVAGYTPDTLVFACSGASDVGELADRTARRLSKQGKGKMYCLAGIGSKVRAMMEMAAAANTIVVIDGCPTGCACKVLQGAGFTPKCYNLKELGFERGMSPASDEFVSRVIKSMGMD